MDNYMVIFVKKKTTDCTDKHGFFYVMPPPLGVHIVLLPVLAGFYKFSASLSKLPQAVSSPVACRPYGAVPCKQNPVGVL